MIQNIEIKQICKYAGHTVKANGIITLVLKADYEQLVNTLELCQLLNNDLTLSVKLPRSKPMKVGEFRIHQIQVSGDGESTLKFTGMSDYIEMNNINMLPVSREEHDTFTVRYFAEVELEDDEAEE